MSSIVLLFNIPSLSGVVSIRTTPNSQNGVYTYIENMLHRIMLHRVLSLCVVVGLRWNEKVLLGRDTLCFIIYINNEFVVWETKKQHPLP